MMGSSNSGKLSGLTKFTRSHEITRGNGKVLGVGLGVQIKNMFFCLLLKLKNQKYKFKKKLIFDLFSKEGFETCEMLIFSRFTTHHRNM